MSAATFLAYLGAILIGAWGIAHVIPTRAVVSGFGPISTDNRLVITQEWLAEALTMWFIASVVVIAAALGGSTEIAHWLYRVAAVTLVAIGTLTALTGARTPVVWFKICPVLLTTSAGLLLLASVI